MLCAVCLALSFGYYEADASRHCVFIQQEISRIIGGNLTLEDEDAVLLELAEIERLEAESLLLAMPEAPTEPVEAGSFVRFTTKVLLC